MFYYKGKIKAVVIIVAVILLLAVAVTFCLWDDTSINSLKATGGTSDYICKNSIPLPVPSNITLGDRLTIDDIKYTVGYKGTVGSESFITLYSDDVSSKGLSQVYDSRGYHYNYDGRVIGWYDPRGGKSQIFTSTQNYYATLASKTVTYDKTGVTYGKVSDYIIPHLDYGWSLWQPSGREVGLSDPNSELSGSLQPVMIYYEEAARRAEGVNADYWLRSPRNDDNLNWIANYIYILDFTYSSSSVVLTKDAVRVALNLKI